MSVYITDSLLEQGGLEQSLRKPRIGWQSYTLSMAPGDVSGLSSAEGFPADSVLRPNTYERWKPENTDDGLVFDLPDNTEVNYVGIAAHTLGSNGVRVNVLDTSFVPEDDSPILVLDTTSTRTALTLGVSENIGEIGVVYFGKILECQRPIYGGHSPARLSRDTTLKRSLSRGGQFLGQQYRRRGFETSVELKNLSPDWYRDEFDPFVEHARRFPFFFAWRPTKYPEDVVFAWCPEDIQPQNSGTRDLMDVSFNLRGFDDD